MIELTSIQFILILLGNMSLFFFLGKYHERWNWNSLIKSGSYKWMGIQPSKSWPRK